MRYSTHKEWKRIAQTYVRGISDDDANEIAAISFAAERAGGNCSIWHSSATHLGRKCNCARCKEGESADARS